MHFTLQLQLDAYHKPTTTWHVYSTTHGLGAVSRKHALNKGIQLVTSWPGYTDRKGDADWTVEATATILEPPTDNDDNQETRR